MRGLFSLALGVACACGTAPTPAGRPADSGPRARLTAPVQVAAGQTATLDASESFDADGTIVLWRFVFGDGSAASDLGFPVTQHAWTEQGLYEVGLTVRDNGGGEARARQLVRVGSSTLTCDGDSDCAQTGTVSCENGICASSGGSLDCEGAPCGGSCASDAECPLGQLCRSGICGG